MMSAIDIPYIYFPLYIDIKGIHSGRNKLTTCGSSMRQNHWQFQVFRISEANLKPAYQLNMRNYWQFQVFRVS